MADVTRYIVDEWWPVEGAERVQDGQLIVIAEADHLAALERVRVETLREVKTAVMHLPVVGRLAGTDSTLAAVHVLAAIDRLIDATTTGATDA